ncbi:peroxiredoxin [Luteipulveratus mongoliensis]|uniref:Alkyl hydroperoxide reductase E n=1 Tax=Luteipulveratus mongoliensis TaxID=571913 RepID=A0A0K1JIR7_9MICO|nr:peroxiredoxin [Luteipulveratus mongoliensis]AKU16619.1 peroxiredoxin [Luteipulveratus mongoliensis]
MRPETGARAPAFSLKDQFGQDTTLASLTQERAVLLVFYPFAFSRICTGELAAIRDDLPHFDNERVQTVGVSCDPMFTLKAWADAEGFDFPLLSDFWPHGVAARAYGVFDEQSGMAVRGTFLVDRDGVVRWALVNGPGEARDFGGFHEALATLDT